MTGRVSSISRLIRRAPFSIPGSIVDGIGDGHGTFGDSHYFSDSQVRLTGFQMIKCIIQGRVSDVSVDVSVCYL